MIMARQAGVQVLLGAEAASRTALLTGADIVLVHFWNNPALHEFLRSSLQPRAEQTALPATALNIV